MFCFWRKELWCVVLQSFRGWDFGFPRPGDLPLSQLGTLALPWHLLMKKCRCSLVYPDGSSPLPSPLSNLSSSNFPGSIFIFHPGNHTFEHMHTCTQTPSIIHFHLLPAGHQFPRASTSPSVSLSADGHCWTQSVELASLGYCFPGNL